MPDGDDQQLLSHSIKSRFQNGNQQSVFRDKGLLDPDAVIDEDRIVGRDKQLEDIITYLRPTLHGDRPPNMFLYGPSGTGKSLIINAVCEQVAELADTQADQFGVTILIVRRSNPMTELFIVSLKVPLLRLTSR